ncbi:uncharacterized protein LOC135502780 isoform X2 [Lineus longissimus]|uniref:uncharacterized protein LOC135502780 isoform X2 n=1 Tax=Lineus longissimus TaxID=88925 RepID=UPI00315D0D9F
MGTGSSQNTENFGAPARDTGNTAVQNNNVGEDKRLGNGHVLHSSVWSPRSGMAEDTVAADRGKMEKSRVDLNEVDKLQADLDKELLQGRETLINNKKRTNGSDVTDDVTSDDFDQEAEEERILNEYNCPGHNGRQESYPETYAEKMRREKYTNEMRFEPVPERVLARPSVDWKVEQDIEGFDPNKFKAVNKTKSEETGANDEDGNRRESNHLKYDITEEELMKDIESEFADL